MAPGAQSRRLDLLRGPAIQEYLARSDAAILPLGPTETHGLHLPLGTDCLISLATAELAAARADALVLPPFAYSWAGATARLPGTISLPADLVQQLLVGILRAAVEAGFKRLAMVCAHGPDVFVATLAGRMAFEQTGYPVAVHHAVPGRGTTARELELAGPLLDTDARDPGQGETSRLHVALEILGLPADLVDGDTRATRGSALPVALTEPMRAGGAGFYFTELSQHIPTPADRDLDTARAYLEATADAIKHSLDAMKELT